MADRTEELWTARKGEGPAAFALRGLHDLQDLYEGVTLRFKDGEVRLALREDGRTRTFREGYENEESVACVVSDALKRSYAEDER